MNSLKMQVPAKLTAKAVDDAAREALPKIGTSLDKVNKIMAAKTRSESGPSPTMSRDSQPAQSKLPKTKSSQGSPAFPPLPTQAPTPVSQLSGTDKAQKTGAKAGSAYPPMSKLKPKPVQSLTAAPPASSGMGKVDVGGLKSLQGLTDSLFAESKDSNPSESRTGVPKSSADPSQSGVDYTTMLKQFYEKHNPAKLGEVAKTLQKYKVSHTNS